AAAPSPDRNPNPCAAVLRRRCGRHASYRTDGGTNSHRRITFVETGNLMLRGASVVCLSSIDWSFNRQNPQEVSLAFAERGNRVLFVENTGVRSATLRDAPRLWSRFLHWW